MLHYFPYKTKPRQTSLSLKAPTIKIPYSLKTLPTEVSEPFFQTQFTLQKLLSIISYTQRQGALKLPIDLYHGSCKTRKFLENLQNAISRVAFSTFQTRATTLSEPKLNPLQVDPDEIIKTLHDDPTNAHKKHIYTKNAVSSVTPYSSRYASQQEIPKYIISQEGAPADSVHQMLKDELDLDGRPNLNLASFVGTYMEREAEALMVENLSKNMSDADEYPAMMAMHARCVSIISHLWGVQKGETAIGSATTGSSEAIHLGGLAMKRRWQEKRDAEGKDKSKPNIIMGSNAQVALEKFARYFEVEARILDVSEKSLYRLDPELVKQNIDENTIGIFVILGSTYTGHYEPVEEISKILDDYEEKTGNDIPIHVDAASGGFVAPFTHAKVGGPKWFFLFPQPTSSQLTIEQELPTSPRKIHQHLRPQIRSRVCRCRLDHLA